MNRSVAARVMVCAFSVLFVFGIQGWAGGPDYDSIAAKLVNNLASVQPGEVVVILGNSDQQELLEALVVATWKAGGQPTVEVNYPRAAKRALMEMPVEYMKFPLWYGLAQARLVDCFINVSSVQDPMLFADVPEERLEAFREAGVPLQRAAQHSRFRSVSLGQTGGVPTAAYAASKNVDYETMAGMFWGAVDTDYGALMKKARLVAGELAPGEAVRVTSGAGTDITFLVGDSPARINCGRPDDNQVASGPMMAWLPAGEAYATVHPGSANGTVVVPSMDFRGMPVKNLRMTFKDGTMASLSAEKNGAAVQDFLDSTTGDSLMLSIVDVGVNADSRPFPGSDYASWEMAGMVTLSTGDNTWAGGSIESSGGLNFHLTGATLIAGGNTLCENGRLK